MKEVTAALIKFQLEVPKIPFNKRVKYGTTDFGYADLATVLDTVRPVLNKHGLMISQAVDAGIDANGTPYGVVRTMVVHESGEGLESKTYYDISGKPQDQGSRITYARRYASLGILGLVGEDDTDCVEQVATGKKDKPVAKKPTPTQPERDAFKQLVAEAKSAIEIKKHQKDFAAKYELTDALKQGLDNYVTEALKGLK